MRVSSSPSISDRKTPLTAACAAALSLLLSACAGSRAIPDPTAKHIEYAERYGYASTLPSLKNGRRLYVNRCSNCHTLHAPSAFTPLQWPTLVQDMANNAEINETQILDITRYLVAVSAAAHPASAPAQTAPAPASTPDSTQSPQGGLQ